MPGANKILAEPKSAALPLFSAPYAPPDEAIARDWLSQPKDAAADARIDALATRLIEAIRSHASGLGGIDDFLHAYSLSTQEGLALMVLAEAAWVSVPIIIAVEEEERMLLLTVMFSVGLTGASALRQACVFRQIASSAVMIGESEIDTFDDETMSMPSAFTPFSRSE